METPWNEQHFTRAAERLKALGHPMRLKILCKLRAGEMAVQDISEQLGTTSSNISQHLSILYSRKLVRSRKEANRVFYSIADPALIELLGCMQGLLCR